MHRTDYHGYLKKDFLFQKSVSGRSIAVTVEWTPGGSDAGEYSITAAWHDDDIDGYDEYPFRRSRNDWKAVIAMILGDDE